VSAVDLPALVEVVRALVASDGHAPDPAADAVLWAGLGGWLEAAGVTYADGGDPAISPAERAWLAGVEQDLFGGAL
jgi:hypothetical protein